MRYTMRSIFIGLILVVLLAVPATAAAPGGTLILSDPTPAVGDTIVVTGADVTGAQDYVGVFGRCDTTGDGTADVVWPGFWFASESSLTMTFTAAGECTALLGTTRDGSKVRILAELSFTVSE